MESSQENSCSVIQYYKGTDTKKFKSNDISNRLETNNTVEPDVKEVLTQNNGDTIKQSTVEQIPNHGSQKGENCVELDIKDMNPEQIGIKQEKMGKNPERTLEKVAEVLLEASQAENNVKVEFDEVKLETSDKNHSELMESEDEPLKRGRKRKVSETGTDSESVNTTNPSTENLEANEEPDETDTDDDEEMENKPRKRGRCKKNPDIIPSHLSSDVVLGYKILLKFLETPQFSCFHKPFKKGTTEGNDNRITCLNQIKKKFDKNSYQKVCEFVNDVREMLTIIYESRNPVAIKRALRLEQILEQRIAQLPNYLRPQCALVLSPDEINNSLNKIRITKGGGFVSLLLEKTEKERSEKNREKRKLLAEERKQLKEEQDKDVQDWEKNVLLKDVEEEIKSMWELPAIGHFIHLCSDLLNIGEVAQYEVERMLLMPQCSDTLDLVMTSLLTNSLVRAKLDRTPAMPYSIWGPLVRTRVVSWYRIWHREDRNEQKLFEEIGVEPDFWQILGPDKNPLDCYYFHELNLLQRVWVLKTLCDVDFVKKKTVHDNIRAQPLEELNPVLLGVDRDGNRYVHLKQFGGTDVRIYRQSVMRGDDIKPSELIESFEGFEQREGAITTDKVFKDIWELAEKPEIKFRRKKITKHKKVKSLPKVVSPPTEKKNLRKSVRAKQKTYVDWSDSDQSDTDLSTLRNKLRRSDPESLYRPFADREFISLSVFRLTRDKLSSKPTGKRSSTATKRTEDTSKNEGTTSDKTMKVESEEPKEDAKPGCEDEETELLEAKPIPESRSHFDKSYQGEETVGEDYDLDEKDDGVSKFKNLSTLKMVLHKGDEDGDEAVMEVESSNANLDLTAGEDIKTEKDVKDIKKVNLYKYNVPNHLRPDSSKFYLVVDSVEGLRQLISKFGSHENDLEIITRSTKSKRKNARCRSQKPKTSCEVKLIEKLQNLLLEMEPWELDLIKSFRTNREKMYKEYMNFINRPPDFVHPNEAYWMKTYEEPVSSTTSTATTTTATVTTTTTATATTVDSNVGNVDKTGGKENGTNTGESVEGSQVENLFDDLGPRKRTRVTRLQLQPESNDLDEDSDDFDDCESNESDDVWVLPTPKKKAKKDATPRASRLPRRSAGRRAKSSPSEKAESPCNSGEKNNSSPEKTKKALFWGPRSSDPSEDLNWETNRQKILEQHNSPIKKLLFGQRSEDSCDDTTDSENTKHQKSENPTTSVITPHPKRFITQIPGNKKPYFSSAQLKAMDNQAKQRKLEEQQRALGGFNPPKPESKTIAESSAVDKVQPFNTTNKPPKLPLGRPRLSAAKQALKTPEGTILHHTLTYQGQIKAQNQGQTTNVVQSIDGSGVKGGVIQQNPITQAQLQQPVGRLQQIQIQQPSGQTRTVTGTMTNVRMQQPVHWQSKVISLQSLGQTGKVVQQQQQVQSQGQVQIQGQPGVQLQGQLQQVIQIDQSKMNTGQPSVQVSPDKLASVQQMIVAQNQGTAPVAGSENDLYITDGKLLIKFDNNFVQQYLQKDKAVAVNVNEKLDLKKPLLIVKPKTDSSSTQTTAQTQATPSTSQQNILVINKPACVQQGVVTSTVPNFVIPGNYIIKDGNQAQAQGSEGQTVKIVQPAPTYVIQQKPIASKDSQPQIIKIITSQPMATNQNILLSSANLNMANQVLCPVNQTLVTTGDQQTKGPTTLRFVRPQGVTTSGHNKVNSGQNPIIVNNVVQIQGQRLEGPRPQTAVVAGRIVSTGVPNVRMASPTMIPSSNGGPQTVRLVKNSNAQPIRITTAVPSRQTSDHTAGTQSSQSVGPGATIINAQSLRLVANPQVHQMQTQIVVPTSNLNSQTASSTGIISNVHTMPSSNQTLLTASSASPQITGPMTFLTSPSRIASGVQPQAILTSSAMVSESEEPTESEDMRTITQSVKSITSSQSQTVLASNAQPLRVVTIAQPQQTSTVVSSGNPIINVHTARGPMNTIVQAVRPTAGTIAQPVRLASGGKPQTIKVIPNNNPGVKIVNKNAASTKGTMMTGSASSPSATASEESRLSDAVAQSVRIQTIVKPGGVPPDGGLHSG